MKKIIGFCLVFTVVHLSSLAQVGIFTDRADVGDPDLGPGLAEFDNGTYTIDAIGTTIDDTEDQFNFVYTEMSGSFAIEAEAFPIDDIGRGGLMIRQSLDSDSIHVSFLTTSESESGGNASFGSVFPTFRTLQSGGTKRDGDPTPNPGGYDDNHIGPIRLEKRGNSVSLFTMNGAGEWVFIQSEALPFQDPVLVGLAASAEDGNALGSFEFTEVAIEELSINVVRTLPSTDFQPGGTYNGVTLTANVSSGAETFFIDEIAPKGSTVSNIQSSAGDVSDVGGNMFTWSLSNHSGEATLSYDLTLPNRRSVAWQGTFTDGLFENSIIGGTVILPTEISFEPLSEPFLVRPGEVTFFEAEQGTVIDDALWGLMADPRVDSGYVAVSMNSSAAHNLEFPLNVEVAGTYYFIWSARGEDGNSDSNHVEIDLPPAGDNTTRSNFGGNKVYENRWIRDSDPGQNPRPFELVQGENFLVVGNREDSASFDWVAVVDNPDVDLATFDPYSLGTDPGTAVQDFMLY